MTFLRCVFTNHVINLFQEYKFSPQFIYQAMHPSPSISIGTYLSTSYDDCVTDCIIFMSHASLLEPRWLPLICFLSLYIWVFWTFWIIWMSQHVVSYLCLTSIVTCFEIHPCSVCQRLTSSWFWLVFLCIRYSFTSW